MGASVQLVAYLNGERFDATEMAHDPWRGLIDYPGYKDLVLAECGRRASRVTRKGRQFFKHYPEVDCDITHKSESAQHLAMKQALKDRVNAVPGWSATVEEAHPGRAWIADVMATHVSGRRLAFEVQLSAQSEEEYVRRSQRYVDDRIGPVWVVPENFEWFRVKLPMIVTGFGKTSDLPLEPAELMELTRYQPMFRITARVTIAVGRVLDPSFSWPHGTPHHQLEELARQQEAEAKAAAAALELAERLAEQKRTAAEEAARVAAERIAQFIAAAAAPGVCGVRPVVAGMRVWASTVRCLKAGHPMLIWNLTEPRLVPAARTDMWMPIAENRSNVRGHVERWLSVSGSGLTKAGIQWLHGGSGQRVFVCPECKDVIKGRWVAALPAGKWSVIAEGSAARAEAREVLYRKPPEPPPPPPALVVPETAQTLPERFKTVHRTAAIVEGDPAFIGPRRWAHWMSEARDLEELGARMAAKDAKAERMRSISENHRYIGSANGFRFRCTDCGGVFEDENEGIHADARCLTRGARSFGWR
ncbi:hypothetical protein [Pseudarthrobacter sp. AB1]|uniref:competence protein CoiA family protein n=1 Tax=Pseudarthrobacter sp. AB1 TaxID=2138309 RepID=UPI00186B5C67|nr:hypothetical protein [Pseudarthrobacter sp. AB1]MBE4719536.1 hypothetical protein [Pseudarthrobacter sp. AB1]